MNLSRLITKWRFIYHGYAIDAGNVLNQLHILSDEAAEKWNRRHFMTGVNLLPFMDKRDILELKEKWER